MRRRGEWTRGFVDEALRRMEGKKGVGDFVVRACSLFFARLEREKDFELA